MTSTKDPSFKLLHFNIEDIYACIDIEHVIKVILLPLLEKVPNSPAYLAGILNYSGKSVPIIDLSFKLGLLRKKHYSLNTPILLCEYKGKQCGIIVDKLFDLIEANKQHIQTDESFITDDSIFSGTILLNTRLALLINIHRIIDVQGNKPS